jgi:SPP1 gp7 family putative phage head morphogenesis protein
LNKFQKEVIQHQLDAEKEVIDQLTKQYQRALNDIDLKIRILQSDELTQSRIYRIEYQKVLKKQVEAVIEKLHADQYTTIQQFLSEAYTDSFVGSAYDMFGQGLSLIMPIDRNAAVKAVVTDSKISEGLYNALGVDTKKLKQSIRAEITRGIASGMPHSEIARNISAHAKAPLGRAKTIVRTESHRIAQAATYDAMKAAKAKGANIVKQWNSTLDGKTRSSHRRIDGQIREVEEPFEMGGKKAMYPGDFGDPAEDCNCRCQLLQRARVAMDKEEFKVLKERAEFFGLDKTKDLDEFKEKYLKTTAEIDAFTKIIIAKTVVNTKKNLEKSQELLYNNTLDQEEIAKALEAYNRAIETGELSPLASFELYQAMSKEIDDVIVGLTTANGIVVTSKSDHFVARVIGSIAQRRSGVSIQDIIQALTKPDRIDPVRINTETGQKSQRFILNGKCAVTINPDTGNLIQVNPLR